MKKRITIILAICALTMTGCGDSDKESAKVKNNDILYQGQRWDMVKVNDSTVVCMPGLNADSELTPVVINFHHKSNSER